MGTPSIPFVANPVAPQNQGPAYPTPPPPETQTPTAGPISQIPQQTMPVQGGPVNGQPSPTPAQAAVAHSAAIGHGFKALINAMSGTSTQWVQTPSGPQQVQVKNPPGQLFKNILAGAIMGGVAGGSVPGSETAGSGWLGAAKGAGAAMQAVQQRNQQSQQNAQQDFENQQKVAQANREQQLVQAQIANMQSETASRQHLTDLQNKEYHDKHNAASAALYDALKDAGGVAPIDGKIPEEVTAYQLAQDYAKDPSIRQAPAGYTRHFIDKTDSDEVTWNGQYWTHPDGSPADMTDKTSVQVVDVPDNALKTRKPTTGAEINKVAGQQLVDPKGIYQMAPLDLIGLNTDRLKNENDAARIRLEQARVAQEGRAQQNEEVRLKHDAYNAAFEQTKLQNDELQKTVADPLASSDDKKAAQSKIDENNQNLKDLYEQTYPETKLKKNEAAPAPPKQAPLANPVVFINPQGQQVQATTQEQVDKATKLGYKKVEPAKPLVTLNANGQAVVNAARTAGNALENAGILP